MKHASSECVCGMKFPAVAHFQNRVSLREPKPERCSCGGGAVGMWMRRPRRRTGKDAPFGFPLFPPAARRRSTQRRGRRSHDPAAHLAVTASFRLSDRRTPSHLRATIKRLWKSSAIRRDPSTPRRAAFARRGAPLRMTQVFRIFQQTVRLPHDDL